MSFESKSTGPIAWMAKNAVAANLLMVALLGGGGLAAMSITQEVFPEFDLDFVNVSVVYRGSSPAEVEQGIVLAVEEAVRTLDGVDRLTSSAAESVGSVTIELARGADADRVLADVKAAVDRIASFPEGIERPLVSLGVRRRMVIAAIVHGHQSEHVLRTIAERVRQDLLNDPGITVVELDGIRPLEISIEIPQSNLRRYGLSITDVASEVRRASVELPGGRVKTAKGEVLLRTSERRDLGGEFEDIVVRSTRSGSQVRLADIATITDGFEDTDQAATFNAEPAVMVTAYRVADQTPTGVADIVARYVERARPDLPPGVNIDIWRDRSEVYRDRMSLLLRNAYLGLVLVLGVLGLFLQLRLAYWVTLGIPVSFLGSLILLRLVDASVNMVSLFAFIVTLGMVVDDAIIVGENIYTRRQKGEPLLHAAIAGTQEVAVPVVFSILTTIVAFAPLMFISGIMGKFLWIMPVVVIAVLALSLVESLFVLPAHLAHTRREATGAITRFIELRSSGISRMLERFIQERYRPLVTAAIRRRYLTLAIGVGALLVTVGLVAGGRIDITFFPRVPSDRIRANAELPFGSAVTETKLVRDRLVAGAQAALKELGGSRKVARGVFAQLGGTVGRGHGGGRRGSGGHLTGVSVHLLPADERGFTTPEFTAAWRKHVGEIPGVRSITYRFHGGPSGGSAIDVQLVHDDLDVLETAAVRTASVLRTFEGVHDIDSGFDAGKPQLDFRITPAGRSLGITALDLGRQVRSAFFGAEALRQQRGRDEIRVMVRLPEGERHSAGDVEALLIRSRDGGEISLGEAANVERGRSYKAIRRVDGRRVVNVTADVDRKVANAAKILARLKTEVLPDIVTEYAGLDYSFEGERRERDESLASMRAGFMVALVVMFALLAIPFSSYSQPAIVMSAIPFGFVGAVFGHIIMGFDLSLISMMGMIALSGVTVNDSLVLIVSINRLRAAGDSPHAAVIAASVRRFRPIIMTSVTTFLGLAPMIFETSRQARFLIPMAISLGYGVLFATFVVLLLVPALYLALEDLRDLWGAEETPPEPALQ